MVLLGDFFVLFLLLPLCFAIIYYNSATVV